MIQHDTEAASARDALRSMVFGYFPAQAVHVAVRLELADHLADGPRPAAEAEFGDLLSAAGFTITQIVPCLPTGYSLIEARPGPAGPER